jgi:hypothetical protein
VLPDTPVFAPRAGGTASSFAALDTAASPFDAFNSFPQSALGYAEATKAPALKAASAVYADGNAVWAKGFGGQRVQDSNGALIGGTTTGAGGAVGYEQRHRSRSEGRRSRWRQHQQDQSLSQRRQHQHRHRVRRRLWP